MQCGSDMKLKRDHESRDRLTCSSPTCGFIFYNNPIPVVAAIVEHWSSKDRKDVDPSNIVLARGIGWPAEAFGLVTGFLEAGEEPSTGCLREVCLAFVVLCSDDCTGERRAWARCRAG